MYILPEKGGMTLCAGRPVRMRMRILVFFCVSFVVLCGWGCRKPSPETVLAERKYAGKVLKILRTCDIQTSRRPKATNLALLSSACPKMHCRELNKHYPDLVNFGGVLIGRLPPGDLRHFDRMLSQGVLSECPACHSDGRECCYTCRGTGICPRCQGTGVMSSRKNTSFCFRMKSDDSREGTDGFRGNNAAFSNARCSIKCSVCRGTGHLAKSCRKCGGKKYLISYQKLRVLYIEQYKIVEAIVKSQAGL